jgi:hypothetical protein
MVETGVHWGWLAPKYSFFFWALEDITNHFIGTQLIFHVFSA